MDRGLNVDIRGMLIAKFFNFKQFFTPWYLLARVPSPLSRPFVFAWLIGGGVLVAIGIVLKLYARFRRALPVPLARWWRRAGTTFILSGLVSFLLLFFRYERAPILGARILMVILLVVALADLGRLLWQRKVKVPLAIAEEERQQRLRKYLP